MVSLHSVLVSSYALSKSAVVVSSTVYVPAFVMGKLPSFRDRDR